MANTRVSLYKYLKLSSGSWRYCKPAYATNNKVKPHIVFTPDGNAERHEEGQYYLGYRNGTQVWEAVGNDPAEAQRLLRKKESELACSEHPHRHGSTGTTAKGDMSSMRRAGANGSRA